MKNGYFKVQAAVNSASIAELSNGDNLTTDVLFRICETMNCYLDDIMDMIYE